MDSIPISREQLAKILTQRYWRNWQRAVADAAEYVVGLVDDPTVAIAIEGGDPMLDLRLDTSLRRVLGLALCPMRHGAVDDDEREGRK